MRISFSGFEHAVDLRADAATVLVIENKVLYARICQSLLSEKGEESVEPYSLWDACGDEIRPSEAFLAVTDPFYLPWKHRALVGQVHRRLNEMLLEDEDVRQRLQDLAMALEAQVGVMSFQLNGEYVFGSEWALVNYLKAFGFDVQRRPGESLFDSLISFIDYVADAQFKRALMFVNLQTFLAEDELNELIGHLIFHGLKALFLENAISQHPLDRRVDYIVDQHFLEIKKQYQPERTSPSQGRICSNVLEQ